MGGLSVYYAGEDFAGQFDEFDVAGDPFWSGTAGAEEDGFEGDAAAHGFKEEVFAFDGDEAFAQTGMACEGGAELLDAGVGAAGDGSGHLREVYAGSAVTIAEVGYTYSGA